MARYLLDTGVLLGYLRTSPYAAFAEQQYQPFTLPNISAISIVTQGELRSLALQLHWGVHKQQRLEEAFRKVPRIDINNDSIIQRYAEIDTFSQGKLTGKDLPPGMSSRNMGKNDLWIAATASVLNATLLTTDDDFSHLHDVFMTVIYIDPKTTI